jgi:cobalt-zinc-cadmium efflux system outer membrane protein
LNTQVSVQRDNATGDTIAGVQLQLPIPIFDRNQGGIRQAQANVSAAARAVDRLTLDLQTRLAAAFQRYNSAQNQVRRYTEPGGILSNAERTLELIRAGYRAEEFSVLDLLNAQTTFSQANLSYLNSLDALWNATLEIRGLLLKDSLK